MSESHLCQRMGVHILPDLSCVSRSVDAPGEVSDSILPQPKAARQEQVKIPSRYAVSIWFFTITKESPTNRPSFNFRRVTIIESTSRFASRGGDACVELVRLVCVQFTRHQPRSYTRMLFVSFVVDHPPCLHHLCIGIFKHLGCNRELPDNRVEVI